jgi:hypothetical protein
MNAQEWVSAATVKIEAVTAAKQLFLDADASVAAAGVIRGEMLTAYNDSVKDLATFASLQPDPIAVPPEEPPPKDPPPGDGDGA